jgi:hypothetical protein
MEWLKVTFDPKDIRRVLADGDDIGPTEAVLMLPAGDYEITLSGHGYTPPQWSGPINGTTAENPQVIVFAKSAGT